MGDDMDTLAIIERDIRSVLALLARSRQLTEQDEAFSLEGLVARIEALSQQIHTLAPPHRQQLQPLLMALLDELNRTVTVFEGDLKSTGDKLASVRQSRAAGAAYRHTQKF